MMKKYYVLLLCLVPLMMFAVSHKPYRNLLKVSPKVKSTDRFWRLDNTVVQDYISMNQAWENDEKNKNFYSLTYPSRMDSIYGYEWDDQDSEWVHSSKVCLSYIPGTDLVTDTETTLLFGEMQIPMMQTESTYDNQDRLTSMIVNFFDFGGSGWLTMVRTYFFYGANNSITVCQTYPGGGVDTPEYGIATSTYDNAGRITQTVWQTSSDSTNWVNDERTTLTYHPNDYSTGATYIYAIAHMFPLMFVNDENSFFGMVSSELTETWNGTAWVVESKEDMAYDATDRLAEIVYKDWNGEYWVNSQLDTFSYNMNGNLAQAIENFWDDMDVSWVPNEKRLYTWTQSTENEDSYAPAIDRIRIATSPNPFIDNARFVVSSKSSEPVQIFIHNLKGQMVNSFSMDSNKAFVWDGKGYNSRELGAGVYFVKAKQGSEVSTLKVLKLK